MPTKSKFIYRLPREGSKDRAKALSISFLPRHLAMLKLRQKQLNIPRSTIVQLLIETESRDGFLKDEIIARFTGSPPPLLWRQGARRERRRK